MAPWRAAGKYVLKCLLSPDVRQLVTTSADKTVKLWNLDGFTLDRTLVGGFRLLHALPVTVSPENPTHGCPGYWQLSVNSSVSMGTACLVSLRRT